METPIIDQFEKEPLIPYGTFLKEQTRKFKNDPTKPQNWEYNEADDYYIDYLGVRFSFYRYSTRKDAYGFKRDIKIYKADKVQVSAELDKLAKTPQRSPTPNSGQSNLELLQRKNKRNPF